jgi:hypothetical protein
LRIWTGAGSPAKTFCPAWMTAALGARWRRREAASSRRSTMPPSPPPGPPVTVRAARHVLSILLERNRPIPAGSQRACLAGGLAEEDRWPYQQRAGSRSAWCRATGEGPAIAEATSPGRQLARRNALVAAMESSCVVIV